MKKRISLGTFGLLRSILIAMFIYLIFMIVSAIKEQSMALFLSDLLSWIVTLSILSIITYFMEGWVCYMELEQDNIKVKKLVKTICSYNAHEVRIRYSTKVYRQYGSCHFHPCLVIGTLPTRALYIDKGYFKVVYDDYFVVIIQNQKHLNAVLSCFNQKVDLPTEEEWAEFNEILNKGKIWKVVYNIQKYYDLIKAHNDRIEQQLL